MRHVAGWTVLKLGGRLEVAVVESVIAKRVTVHDWKVMLDTEKGDTGTTGRICIGLRQGCVTAVLKKCARAGNVAAAEPNQPTSTASVCLR